MSTSNSVKAGDVAGRGSGGGYRQISVDNRLYLAHRLAWLYMTGEWPEVQIDHVNMDRADNRFVNLRQATRSENKGNMRAQANNASGLKGVYWHKRAGKWCAQINTNGTRRHLGCFDSPEAAHAAYIASAKKHFGEFARFA